MHTLVRMSERRAIVVFTEGDFEEACTRPTLGEARAMADGIVCGAGYYGAGSCNVYVLPDDAEQMIEEIDAGDLMRATDAAEEALREAEVLCGIVDG